MRTDQALLYALQQSRTHHLSGEHLAHSLGISRTAVWKGVEKLRDEGHLIEGIPNLGYRLLSVTPLFDETALRSSLAEWSIHLFDVIDSTNRYAKLLAHERGERKAVVISLAQREGRGRLGRSFHSPQGGLYLTILLPSEFSLEEASLLTSIASVATHRAIYETSGKLCTIKWVNDLYLEGRKICGILTEGIIGVESSRLSSVAIGIGINLYTQRSEFPADLQEKVTSLYDGFDQVDPAFEANALVTSIVRGVETLIGALPSREYLQYYRRHSLILGKWVTVSEGGNSYPALVHSIDDQAHLIVEDEEKRMHILSSAEISIHLVR